jgi:glycosyltransferase involved in cell wall biosynthesis
MNPPSYDILLVTENNLHQTVLCLDALLRTLPPNASITILDNGSTDGTRAYLREMSARASPIARVVFNEARVGWYGAINAGLRETRGCYIVILSNDVRVGPEWLEGLSDCMDRAPALLADIQKVGLVGPVANCARNRHQVVDAHYTAETFDEYARRHQTAHARRWVPALFLSGFCALMRRECYEAVGGFDEHLTAGGYCENDLCLRAQEKGWHAVVAGDVLVHRMRAEECMNGGAGMPENRAGALSLLFDKWRARKAGPRRLVAVYRVKNGADTLPQSLAATRRFADAIVVLDDGSTDATAEICKRHEAVSCYEYQTLAFDERRDRNRILELAARFDPDWVISIDADEVFEMERERAQRLMHLSDPHIQALGFHWYTFWDPAHTYFRADGAFGQTNGFRMYRWAPGQSIVLGTPEGLHCGNIPQFAEGAHRFTNVRVRHLGYDSDEKRQAKFRFYREVDGNPQEYLVGSKDYSHLVSPTVTLRKYSKTFGVSLCLITRNEEERLEAFLSFFEPYVDEICIVDTGSTDRTLPIARHYTQKIDCLQPDRLELDQARNRSLALATQPWILALDPDEEIAFWDMSRLQRLVDDLEAHAFSFDVVNYQKEGGPVMTVALRLFRRDGRIFYSNPVHETIEQSLRAIPNAVIKPAGFPIHHYGYLKDDTQIQKKIEAYFQRNQAHRLAHPHEPMPWYNEALHYLNEGQTGLAVQFLNQALELDPGFTAPYGQLAYINQEQAMMFWQSLLQIIPDSHPGRPQAQQALDSLRAITPPRHLVGQARTRGAGMPSSAGGGEQRGK